MNVCLFTSGKSEQISLSLYGLSSSFTSIEQGYQDMKWNTREVSKLGIEFESAKGFTHVFEHLLQIVGNFMRIIVHLSEDKVVSQLEMSLKLI